jgi:hypothetical protein
MLKVDRREFICDSSIALATVSGISEIRSLAQTTVGTKGQEFDSAPLNPELAVNIDAVRPRGHWQTDLAPDQLYYSPENIFFHRPVVFAPLTWDLAWEYIFALPFVPMMSGSDRHRADSGD